MAHQPKPAQNLHETFLHEEFLHETARKTLVFLHWPAWTSCTGRRAKRKRHWQETSTGTGKGFGTKLRRTTEAPYSPVASAETLVSVGWQSSFLHFRGVPVSGAPVFRSR